MTACDGDVRFQILQVRIGGGLPGGATRAFDKAEGFIEVNGFGIIGADVQPDVIHLLFLGVLHGADGEGAGDSAAAMIGVDGNVGDKVEALFIPFEGHEADVADDVMSFFPDVAGERQGGGFCDAVRPFEEGVVAACAAHVLHVTPAVAIHGG